MKKIKGVSIQKFEDANGNPQIPKLPSIVFRNFFDAMLKNAKHQPIGIVETGRINFTGDVELVMRGEDRRLLFDVLYLKIRYLDGTNTCDLTGVIFDDFLEVSAIGSVMDSDFLVDINNDCPLFNRVFSDDDIIEERKRLSRRLILELAKSEVKNQEPFVLTIEKPKSK